MRRVFVALMTASIAISSGIAMAGDQETARQLAAYLETSGKLKGYKIDVKVQNSTAWLQGTVSSQQQMRDALGLAKQMPGISRVVNDLNVVDMSAMSGSSSSGLQQPSSYAYEAGAGTTQNGSNRRSAQVRQASAEMPEHAEAMLAFGSGSGTDQDVMPTTAMNQMNQPRMNQQQAMNQQAMNQRQAMYQQQAMNQQPPRGYNPMMANRASYGAPNQQGAGYGGPGGPPPAGMVPPGMAMQGPMTGSPIPSYAPGVANGAAPARYDHPYMPPYAWPSYAAYPNYSAVTYPKQYSPTAWPFIGPFYPYPQVPLGWRKVSLQWDDGWWWLDFKD